MLWSMSPTLTSVASASYVDNWKAAREAKEQQRRDPYGFLSYAGFHKLGPAPASFEGIPGRWSTGADGPRVQLSEDEELLVEGQAVTGSHQFAPVTEREFRRAAPTASCPTPASTSSALLRRASWASIADMPSGGV